MRWETVWLPSSKPASRNLCSISQLVESTCPAIIKPVAGISLILMVFIIISKWKFLLEPTKGKSSIVIATSFVAKALVVRIIERTKIKNEDFLNKIIPRILWLCTYVFLGNFCYQDSGIIYLIRMKEMIHTTILMSLKVSMQHKYSDSDAFMMF